MRKSCRRRHKTICSRRRKKRPVISDECDKNLNTTSKRILTKVPGLGHTLACRIMDVRPISNFEEMYDSVKGFGETLHKKLEHLGFFVGEDENETSFNLSKVLEQEELEKLRVQNKQLQEEVQTLKEQLQEKINKPAQPAQPVSDCWKNTFEIDDKQECMEKYREKILLEIIKNPHEFNIEQIRDNKLGCYGEILLNFLQLS